MTQYELPATSTLLLMVLMVIVASLLFIFTNETMDITFDELSKNWKLRIGNVGYNQSCVGFTLPM
jgi:hypothetical protein